MKKLIISNEGDAYLVNEDQKIDYEDIIPIIESEFQPHILDEYLYVQKSGARAGVIIPKGQKVYYLNELFIDYDDDMERYYEYLEENPQYSQYPIIVHDSSTGDHWLAGPTDFDMYRQQMRDLLFRYSKSEVAEVGINNEYYIGVLQPGLSILHDSFGEYADLRPNYWEIVDSILYETNLPLERVLKSKTDPYPIYVKDDLIYTSPRPNAKIMWISGIFKFPTGPYDKNYELKIKEQLKQMSVNPPRNRYTYTSDVDIYV